MNIFRLMKKDIRLQKSFLIPLLAIEITGFLIFALQMPFMVPGVMFGLLHGMALIGDFLLCLRTMASEEKTRALLFIKMLPVSTREIIVAKFLVNFLLVSTNMCALFVLWEVALLSGRLTVGPSLTLYVIVIGLAVHWLNNGFFLALSFIFDSERAIWVPFPVLFLVMSVILNFRKLKIVLHLNPFVQLLTDHRVLLIVLLWIVYASFLWASSWAMARKRIFA